MISKEEMKEMTLEDFIAYYEELVRVDEASRMLGYLSFMNDANVARITEEYKQLLELLKELHNHREFLNWLENHILPNEWEYYQEQYKSRFDNRKSEV